MILDEDYDPGANDDIFIFTSPTLDISRYVVQFHDNYIHNQLYGLNSKLRRHLHQVKTRLKSIAGNQYMSILKLSASFRDLHEESNSEMIIMQFRARIKSLMDHSFSDLPLPNLSDPIQSGITEAELQQIEKFINDGYLELAVDSLLATKKLLLPPSQQLKILDFEQRLQSVFVCRIRRQMLLLQRRSNKPYISRLSGMTMNLQLLVKIGKHVDALAVFFEVHTHLQDITISRICTDETVPSTCCLSIASFCCEVVLAAMQQFQVVLIKHHPMSRFVAWAASFMTTASALISALVPNCNSSDASKIISQLHERLDVLSNSGMNFWFILDRSLTILANGNSTIKL